MTRPRRQAFTLVQLILAVFVMGVFLRIVLHVGEAPDTRQAHHEASAFQYQGPYASKLEKFQTPHLMVRDAEEAANESVVVTVKPEHLDRDRDRGPLLARVLRQYRPLTTDEQVDGLVDTLPPNASPSVIVIIPSVEKPETPDAEKSCRTRTVPVSNTDDAPIAEDEAIDAAEGEGEETDESAPEASECCPADAD